MNFPAHIRQQIVIPQGGLTCPLCGAPAVGKSRQVLSWNRKPVMLCPEGHEWTLPQLPPPLVDLAPVAA